MITDDFGGQVLNIYGQAHWHSDAWIRGGRCAIVRLRGIIDDALIHGQGEFETFCSDGETYTVKVIVLSDDEAERQTVPYTNIF